MSMKRSKEVSRGRAREVDGGFWDKKEPERVYTWESDVAARPDEAFVAYAPAQRYSKDVLVTHAKFGKGIVTEVDGAKIDVLFQDGQKKLTHGLAGGPVITPKVIEASEESVPAAEYPAAITVPAPPPTHMIEPEPTAVMPAPPAMPEAPSTFEPPASPSEDPLLHNTMDPPTDPDPNAGGGSA